jgi:hypothetical protein
MGTRNASELAGPNISLNVKLCAFFFAIIEQTGMVRHGPLTHHVATPRPRFREKTL